MNTMIKAMVCFLLLVLCSCASSRSGNVYSRDQARITHAVETGTVEMVTEVEIEGTKGQVGVVAGGAAGGAIGSTIGSGSGRTVAMVIGAIIGGFTGAAAEGKITQKAGLEITVKLDSGTTLIVVQEADEAFQAGDRVRVIKGSDGTTRIRH